MNHAVYFYEDDTFLIDNVASFAKEGLEGQEAVIIVATEQHRETHKCQHQCDDAREKQNFDGIEPHGAQRIDLFSHLHGA